MNPKLNSAITYAKDNFKVFPLNVNSKSEQIVHSWPIEATTDMSKIEEWFKNHDYNIGVKTGNGLIVIDIDVKNDVDGRNSIKEFLPDFPKTKVVKTPSGGFHLYYRVDREIRNRIGIYPGVDIRGDGGYIVGIESIINDCKYELINDHLIADANEAVYQFVESKNKNNLEKISDLIPVGQRNDILFKLGCSLHNKGLLQESIYAAIQKENELHCEVPLEEKEIQQIIKGITKRYTKGLLPRNIQDNASEYFNAAKLITQHYVDEAEIVEDLISIGVTLFGAPQKIGKTFFALQLSNAIASGADFLGKKVEQGNVLYFALEDSKNKINKRLKNFNIPISECLNFKIIKPFDPLFNVEEEIKKELSIHPTLKMIVIDTFPKIRKEVKVDYQTEYEELSKYHELGMKYGIAILLILHVRKSIDKNNAFDNIYGSRGVTAAADGMIVLLRHEVMPRLKDLYVIGKDIPENSYVLKQDERLLYSIEENIEEESNLDENLIKLINYVVSKKEYTGTHQELCSQASLAIEARRLSGLIRGHMKELNDNYILVDYPPRTSKARVIHLRYVGNEELEN